MDLEAKCKKALQTLDGDLAEKSITELSNDEINKLVSDHILYNEGLNKWATLMVYFDLLFSLLNVCFVFRDTSLKLERTMIGR